ncbi:MAG: four helix bundle protein [Candidatus Saccharimonadales bacterium]
MKAKSFKDLLVWQQAYKLTIVVYRVTAKFPKAELFGLTNQLRRASVSVSSNIAEGFGRKGAKEKDQFYAMAHGSLTEVENQLLVAKGVNYLSPTEFNQLEEIRILTAKLLMGLQKANKLKGATK